MRTYTGFKGTLKAWKMIGWQPGSWSMEMSWKRIGSLTAASFRKRSNKTRLAIATLKQHFLGWEIETRSPAFDSSAVTLFDVRTEQREGLCFFYILPFDDRRALVEYTLFSANLLPREDYEQALRGYIQEELGVSEYHIADEEQGSYPMTNHPFPRRLGKRIMAIGTRGGRVKPSTGYAFAPHPERLTSHGPVVGFARSSLCRTGILGQAQIL
jgi:hypothetical protein